MHSRCTLSQIQIVLFNSGVFLEMVTDCV